MFFVLTQLIVLFLYYVNLIISKIKPISIKQTHQASTSSDHRLILSLINCKIIVQFLKLYQLVSLTLATPSSKALLARSKAFYCSPHLSYKNTDILRCRLSLTSWVGGKLLRASLSASLQHQDALWKYFYSSPSISQRYLQKSAFIFKQNILSSLETLCIFPYSTIFIILRHVFINQFSIFALQFLRATPIYFVCFPLTFLAIAFNTFISALLLLTKFLQADAHKFLSAPLNCQPKSKSLSADSTISSYLSVCWASFVYRVSSYFVLALLVSIIFKMGFVYYNRTFRAYCIEKRLKSSMMTSSNQFSEKEIDHFMDLALQEARLASTQNEVPVGCIFVNQEKEVVASSHNLTNKYKNASRHCQINCIERLTQSKINVSELTLFVTVEPCIMCTYALNLMKIGKVYFGQFNQRFGGCGSVLKANQFQFSGGIKEKQSLMILRTFYEKGNQNIPQQLRNKSRKRVKKQKQQRLQ